nr:protein ALP1-like isoform X2 [Tanacetum cinerariifolium]
NIHHSHLCWIYALAIKSSQRQAFVPSIDDKDSRRNDMQTQIDVIIAAFTLHSYIRNSDEENMTFTMIEQHPNYISSDELHDVHGHETDTEKSLNEHLMR